MDPLTGALVKGGIELVGGIVQGVTGYQIAQTQAGVAREQIAAQERAARELEETRRRQLEASVQLGAVNAGVSRDRAYYGSQNWRSTVFYGNQTARTLGLVALGVVGLGALAYALKEAK